jgi:hypothetical protein
MQIVGKKDMQHIIRLQLALMKPGVSDIKIHVDSGGYAIRGHRLHIPVFTHPEVSFDVCPHRYVPDPAHVPGPGEAQRMLDVQECFKIPTVEGFAFELNNRCVALVMCFHPAKIRSNENWVKGCGSCPAAASRWATHAGLLPHAFELVLL